MPDLLYPPEPSPAPPAPPPAPKPPRAATWMARLCGAVAVPLGVACWLAAMAACLALPRVETGHTVVLLLASAVAVASLALLRGGGALLALRRQPDARAPAALGWVAMGGFLAAAPGAAACGAIANAAYGGGARPVDALWNDGGAWLWLAGVPLATAVVAGLAWLWWRRPLAAEAEPAFDPRWRRWVRRGTAGALALGLAGVLALTPFKLPARAPDGSLRDDTLPELVALLDKDTGPGGRAYRELRRVWEREIPAPVTFGGPPGTNGTRVRVWPPLRGADYSGVPMAAVSLAEPPAAEAALRLARHGGDAAAAAPALALLVSDGDQRERLAALEALADIGPPAATAAWPALEEAATWPPERWPNGRVGPRMLLQALFNVDAPRAELVCVASLADAERAVHREVREWMGARWRAPEHSHTHAPGLGNALRAAATGPDPVAAAATIALCLEPAAPCAVETETLAAVLADAHTRWEAVAALGRAERPAAAMLDVVRQAAAAADPAFGDVLRGVLRGHEAARSD